ncbi:MAG: translation elongation factor 4 [Bacilli bacterium]|nr:translation elongation factor 4 [Bacilli bacterium]MBR6137750.1 translation elongation factor 4 [Bacilli bacterium]
MFKEVSTMKQENIRNFCIIAHIDHGKSTLADRILERTGAIDKRELKDQMLDSMDLERERGITIKLNAVQLIYKKDNVDYQLNLIDTPGHVDFSYEVSRSLAACEGALLVVDAAQGIEAQTLANLYLALDNNLTIIPVINKIDLPSADPEKVTKELENIGFDREDIVLTSAKTGVGIDDLLEHIIDKIPSPKGEENKPLKALIFDSLFDSYRGIITSIRIKEGSVHKGDIIKMMETNATYDVVGLSINNPKEQEVSVLKAGEVGYLYAAIKSINDVHVGDTITLADNPAEDRLPGYKPMKPTVYCGMYPIESNKFEDLREALNKLKLNDAALTFEPETSKALGFGFRCGFLGLLHMEIVEERIEREFGIDLIATSPSVVYEVELNDKSKVIVDNPSKMPKREFINKTYEPFVKCSIFTPSEYIGPLMELCQDKRGTFLNIDYIDTERVTINYELPLSEIVYDFFDRLKSCTKGYASFDYEVIGYKASDLVKMDILLNGEVVDALSVIVHKDFAYSRGRIVCEKLKEIIPRQLFEVPIQAAIGMHIIARETVKALRKDVLAKCYGGDITRKKKLLEKQKEGKKRMKQIGSVEVPQEAFLSILSTKE